MRRVAGWYLAAVAGFTAVYVWFGWRWHAVKEARAAVTAAAREGVGGRR